MSSAAKGALSQQGFTSLAAGDELGWSDWVTVKQSLLDKFGAATLDDDPMHVDPEWARDVGPFGQTVAFGFWTISLLTHMFHTATRSGPARGGAAEGYYLNYGMNRLRLITPVPVDRRIRGHFRVKDVKKDPKGRTLVTFDVTVEIEASERPALVAEWLAIWINP